MILAFSFMIFFLVFSAGMVYLDSLELGKSYILDDDEQYIHAQSRLPHIKFLADKSVKSDEQIIALKKGTLFPHLCEWLQDNIRANFKVLLIPQQRWGISLFESLIGYQLKKSVGGRLRIY